MVRPKSFFVSVRLRAISAKASSHRSVWNVLREVHITVLTVEGFRVAPVSARTTANVSQEPATKMDLEWGMHSQHPKRRTATFSG